MIHILLLEKSRCLKSFNVEWSFMSRLTLGLKIQQPQLYFYTFNASILSILLCFYTFNTSILSMLLCSYTFNPPTLLHFQHFYTFNTSILSILLYFNTSILSILLYFQYFYTSTASALLWCALIIKCPHRFMILQVGEGGGPLWVARANSILVPLHIYKSTVMRVCSYAGVQLCGCAAMLVCNHAVFVASSCWFCQVCSTDLTCLEACI